MTSCPPPMLERQVSLAEFVCADERLGFFDAPA
jgi:hypothetical protein